MNNQKNFSITEVIKEAWALTMDHLLFLVGVTFLVMVLSIGGQVLQGIVDKSELSPGTAFAVLAIIFLATFIISTIMKIGLLRIMLRITHEEKPDWGDLIRDRRLFFRYLGASILVGIIVMIGFLLLIIPGIIFALALSFFGVHIVDKNTGITESLKRSWELTKGVRLKLLGFFIILGLINLLGLLALGIGLLITVPLSMVAQVVVYRKLTSASDMLPLQTPSQPVTV